MIGKDFSFTFEDIEEVNEYRGKTYCLVFIAHEDDIEGDRGEKRFWPDWTREEALTSRISREDLERLGIGSNCMECCYEVYGTPDEIIERLTEAGFRYVEDWQDL